MSSNDLWQKLANQALQQNQPQQSTIELPGQPQSVEQVLNQSVFVGVPTDEDEYDDNNEEEEFEEGVDDPNRPPNNFDLASLLGNETAKLNEVVKSPPTNQGISTDIFSMIGGTNPVTSVNNPQVEVAAKRGRGRPPKAESEKVINQLVQIPVNTEQDQFKSSQIPTQQSTFVKQNTKEVAVSLPKATLREIGESLQRIGAACIAVANS